MKVKNRQKIVIIILGFIYLVLIGTFIVFFDKLNFQRHLMLGNRYFELERYKEASEIFEKAIKIDNLDAECYIGAYMAYTQMGDEKHAIEVLDRGFKYTSDESIKTILDKVNPQEEMSDHEKASQGDPDELKNSKIVDVDEINNSVDVSENKLNKDNLWLFIDAAEDMWGKPWYEWTGDEISDYLGLYETELEGFDQEEFCPSCGGKMVHRYPHFDGAYHPFSYHADADADLSCYEKNGQIRGGDLGGGIAIVPGIFLYIDLFYDSSSPVSYQDKLMDWKLATFARDHNWTNEKDMMAFFGVEPNNKYKVDKMEVNTDINSVTIKKDSFEYTISRSVIGCERKL